MRACLTGLMKTVRLALIRKKAGWLDSWITSVTFAMCFADTLAMDACKPNRILKKKNLITACSLFISLKSRQRVYMVYYINWCSTCTWVRPLLRTLKKTFCMICDEIVLSLMFNGYTSSVLIYLTQPAEIQIAFPESFVHHQPLCFPCLK